MRLVIATGIFPPDIGGPASYLKRLFFELEKKGFQTKIITYADQHSKQKESSASRIWRGYPLPLRYFFYSWHLFKLAKQSDLIYAQDLFSCGIPASLVKRILRKKLVIRLGGDFLWEKAVSRGWTKKPLAQYYQEPKNFLEKLFIKIGQFVLKSADIVIFSTDWQRDIYLGNYHFNPEKIRIIENPFPQIESREIGLKENKIVFAGRLIKLKNLDFLIRAFSQIVAKRLDLRLEIIGQGPEKENLENLVRHLDLAGNVSFKRKMIQEHLVEEIRHSLMVVLPSLTEISPNLVLECIKLKKPIILTDRTGYYQKFKDSLIFVNPFDQSDLEKKIISLLDRENYQKYQERISLIPTEYSWPEAVKAHLDIFGQLNESNF